MIGAITSISIDFETIESAYSNCNFWPREEITRSFMYGNETNYWIEFLEHLKFFYEFFIHFAKRYVTVAIQWQFIVRRIINCWWEKWWQWYFIVNTMVQKIVIIINYCDYNRKNLLNGKKICKPRIFIKLHLNLYNFLSILLSLVSISISFIISRNKNIIELQSFFYKNDQNVRLKAKFRL